MSTLFKKDPDNLGRVIDEINPENDWVFTDEGVKATRKFDGTSCAIINGKLYKRYDAKGEAIMQYDSSEDYPTGYEFVTKKSIPDNAIPCQDPDLTSGHWPHWVPCNRDNPSDKYHWEAFDQYMEQFYPKTRLSVDQSLLLEDSWAKNKTHDGTYELCGPKVQGNPEGFEEHTLVHHGSEEMLIGSAKFMEYIGMTWQDVPVEDQFESLRLVLLCINVEGIVFHHPDGRMCKIRKKDFGLKR